MESILEAVSSACSRSQNEIPIVFGLEEFAPTADNHKAFSAAFATTSSVAMYHMAGITPEADEAVNSLCSTIKSIDVDIPDLVTSWDELNSSSIWYICWTTRS